MKRSVRAAVALLAVVALLVPATALAAVPRETVDKPGWQHRSDKRPHPLGDRQMELKRRALAAVVKGKAVGDVYEVEDGVFVPLALEGEDAVWTVPGEFADFLHNSIPEPDRTVDNSTLWEPDFSQAYYNGILYAETGNSMRNYFLEQSSGRYAVTGDVTPWVTVPGNAASYDDGDPGRGSAAQVWQFLEDSVDGWYQMQLDAGKSEAEIAAYLASFDVWDRYDYDGDGEMNEPDGYIDHFQSLHAGEGNEAGGGALGDAAIWSHSWYARYNLMGSAGPSYNKAGGIQIGTTSYWIGDYTIQPENGGVGVFTHEFTHDLGIPDFYDTAGGENSTEFWTNMSSGSWLTENAVDIGSTPNHLGPWEKLALGWLDYTEAAPGTNNLTLGPAEYSSTKPQALLVNLPDKRVTKNLGAPYAGSWMYYSGTGDNVDNLMYKAVTLPAGASLTAKVFYQIELDWDYAYVVVSTDGGATWTSVPTNLSTSTDPNAQNLGYGITGSTRRWKSLTADLSAYTGDVLVGFRYWTDGAYSESGLLVDAVSIAGGPVDGAEVEAGWTYDGFKRSTGVEDGYFTNFYLAEYRQYWGYDRTLQVGPYFFGYLKGKGSMPNYVDHFPYQDGLVVWYCDTSQGDNNVSQHPGSGFALVVDAHPVPLVRIDRYLWRNRVQAYDASFGLEVTDALSLHVNGKLSPVPSLAAVPTFDDALSYWNSGNPMGSVKTPTTGTAITVLGTKAGTDGGGYMGLSVTAPALP
jgi:immune inhibitor A